MDTDLRQRYRHYRPWSEKAIRFDDFDDAAATQGGVVTYREFDVFGSPTTMH